MAAMKRPTIWPAVAALLLAACNNPGSNADPQPRAETKTGSSSEAPAVAASVTPEPATPSAPSRPAPSAALGTDPPVPAEVLPAFAVARLGQVAPQAPTLESPGHTGTVNHLAWSGDGSTLASVGADGGVRLWDTQSWTQRRLIPGPPGPDHHVALSHDGARVIWNHGAEVFVHEGHSGEALHTLAHSGPSVAVAITPDAAQLASGGADGLRIWDAEGDPAHRIERGDHSVSSLLFDREGTVLAAGWDDGRVQLIDGHSGKVRRTLEAGVKVETLALSGNGARVAARTGPTAAKVFEVSSGKPLASLAYPFVFGLDRGGNLLLAASPAGADSLSLQLIDVATGDPARDHPGHTASLRAASFAPDGLLFASASEDATILIWIAP